MLPKEGQLVQYWRRDPGGKSQLVTAEVLEVSEPSWCYIKRLDTGEERAIDPERLEWSGKPAKEKKEKPIDQKRVDELLQTMNRKYTKGKDE